MPHLVCFAARLSFLHFRHSDVTELRRKCKEKEQRSRSEITAGGTGVHLKCRSGIKFGSCFKLTKHISENAGLLEGWSAQVFTFKNSFHLIIHLYRERDFLLP